MPKVEIDYSNTIFYKIYCVNPEITDMYIGHTTNFVQRKHAHKQSCTNNKCLGYTCKLYNYIREHGGWNNWIMEIIAVHNCEDHYSARMREQEYFKEYNATLNSIEPLPPPKIKKDKIEKIKKMLTNANEKTPKKNPKNPKIYSCDICRFKCSNKKDYARHFLTAKHKMLTNANEKTPKNPKIFMCSCGKEYKQAPSLTRHKKKCTYVDNINHDISDDDISDDDISDDDISDDETPYEIQNSISEPTSDASIILRLLKQNQEFKELMIEEHSAVVALQHQNMELQSQFVDVVKNGVTINNNTTNNNTTNNNQFNLNFFLNDTCKDAMNITDFLGNLDVQLDELEYIGHHGYVNGMTKMIMERLKDMDITKRPIHCTDVKRETMYIKDKDEWCKDTDELVKLRRILNSISMNNYRTVPAWQTAHPDSEVMDSRNNNFCYKMMRIILGDVEDEQIRLDNKIIKTMAKDLFVNKNRI